MEPVTIVLGLALAGGGLWAWKKHKAAPEPVRLNPVPGQAPGQFTGIVATLTKGKTYAILAQVDLSKFPKPPTVQETSDQLKGWFEHLGFKVLSQPMLRMQPPAGVKLTEWTFNGQWQKDEPRITEANPSIPNCQFVLLPVI